MRSIIINHQHYQIMKNLIFKTEKLEFEQAWIDYQIKELKAKREATCWETYKKERKERKEAFNKFEKETKANWEKNNI